MNGLKRAIDILGRAGVADAAGLKTPEAVTNWKARGGMVPAKHCLAIEKACGGKVTVNDLNPAVFGKPEQAA
jgi:DNA-binding transcriptional regulator YdaS (Cro superfamily)